MKLQTAKSKQKTATESESGRKQRPQIISIGYDTQNPWSSSSSLQNQVRSDAHLGCVPSLRIEMYPESKNLLNSTTPTGKVDVKSTKVKETVDAQQRFKSCRTLLDLFARLASCSETWLCRFASEVSSVHSNRVIVGFQEITAKEASLEKQRMFNERLLKRRSKKDKNNRAKKQQQQQPDSKGLQVAAVKEEPEARIDGETRAQILERKRGLEQESYASGLVMDAILPTLAACSLALYDPELAAGYVPPNGSQSVVTGTGDLSSRIDHVTHEGSVKDLSGMICAMFQNNPQITKHHPFQKLLHKVDPRKGARRSFEVIADEIADSSPLVVPLLASLVLCSLLGNYRHCAPDTRPPLEVRWYLTALFGSHVCFPLSTIDGAPDLSSSSSNSSSSSSRSTPADGKYPVPGKQHNFSKNAVWLSSAQTARKNIMRTLITRCRFMVEIALREYIMTVVDDHPALQARWADLIDLQHYRTTVHQASAAGRLYFAKEAHAHGKMSLLHLCASEDSADPLYISELNACLKPLFMKMVKLSYRDIQPSFIVRLRQEAGTVTANPRDWQRKYGFLASSEAEFEGVQGLFNSSPSDVKNGNGDDDDDDEKENADDEALDTFGQEAERAAAEEAKLLQILMQDEPDMKALQVLAENPELFMQHQQRQANKNAHDVPRQEEETEDTVHLCVRAAHSRVLHDLCSRFIGRLDSDNVLAEIVRLWPAFGEPAAVVDMVLDCIRRNGRRQGTKNEWQKTFNTLRRDYPYAYCLLQESRMLLDRYGAIRTWSLPKYVCDAQLQAFTERDPRLQAPFGSACQAMVDIDSHFWLCSVCMQYYSIVANSHTTHRQINTHGLWDPLVDLMTSRAFCRNSTRFGTHECQSQELSRICILWQQLNIRNRIYQICPQRACRNIMQLQPQLCVWTERGPACWPCTRRIMQERIEEQVLSSPLRHLLHKPTCHVGQHAIATQTDTFVYGRLAVCKKHHSAAMVTKLHEILPAEAINDCGNAKYDKIIGDALILYFRERQTVLNRPVPKNQRKTPVASKSASRKAHWGY